MKPSILRRIRRRTASHEVGNAKKENTQEQSFFGEGTNQTFFQPAPIVQRKCKGCEEEDKKVQRQPEKKEEEKVMRAEDKKEEEKIVQKKEDMKEEEKVMKKEEKEEEKPIQKKEISSNSSAVNSASNYIGSLNGKGNPLPANSNHFFSSKMGYDFSNVIIHTDKEAVESAKDVNAKAYTVGNHIVFNNGQYNTESSDGKKLIAHELAHVVQQKNEVREIARSPKDDTEKSYKIRITKGDKDWSPSEIQLLINALKRLNKKEKKVTAGYEFVRWSNKAARIKADKTYIPPNESTEENCLHEQNFDTGIYRITAYDSCFGDPEAKSQKEYGIDSGEFKLLHEIGHLMQEAEFRMAFLEFQKANEKERGKKSEAADDVKDKSQQDFDKLTKGKDKFPSSDPANAEQFAEGFAIYKADPAFLKKKNSALYEWFKKTNHLKRIK